MVAYINLTGYEIRMPVHFGEKTLIIKSTGVAGVNHISTCTGGLRCFRVGKVCGLPEPRKGVVYIVEPLVMIAARDRDDLVTVPIESDLDPRYDHIFVDGFTAGPSDEEGV